MQESNVTGYHLECFGRKKNVHEEEKNMKKKKLTSGWNISSNFLQKDQFIGTWK